jgi:hypothetical protein
LRGVRFFTSARIFSMRSRDDISHVTRNELSSSIKNNSLSPVSNPSCFRSGAGMTACPRLDNVDVYGMVITLLTFKFNLTVS